MEGLPFSEWGGEAGESDWERTGREGESVIRLEKIKFIKLIKK